MTAVEELQRVMAPYGRELDEPDSIELLAAVRERGLLTDAQWSKVLRWLDHAMKSLCNENQAESTDVIDVDAAPRNADLIRIVVDADDRNADWIKIVRAQRLSGYALPSWAALWLWWAAPDEDDPRWALIGEVAAELRLPRTERR